MHKLGVVVPFRNRWEHLNTFTQCITKYLTDSGIDYRLIIVEQDDASAFNRGMLCNIGFLQAKKLKCDYVIFHDVDMLPINVDYSYSEHPVHLASDNIPFESYFGGITLFPTEQFEKINGFSNHYWGWGYEDDDLRYRCEINKLDYTPNKLKKIPYSKNTVYFNGIDSYVEIENKIKYVRDFTIDLSLRLGNLKYSTEKIVDTYPILTLKGSDFKLYFSSFNRFTLQFFDKKRKYYDITSKIIQNRGNRLKIIYSHKVNTVALLVNGEEAGTIQMDNKLLNYKDSENIILGTDIEKQNYFCGAVDSIYATSNTQVYFEFKSENVEDYKWSDKTDTYNIFHKVEHKKWRPIEFIGTKTPHRRKSIIQRLEHEDSGFSQGKWKHDVTRWNQLRFNNEVVFGNKSTKNDGLNTCEYTTHSKKVNKRNTHIKVGI